MNSNSPEQPTILLVDDALENLKSLIVFLEESGFRIVIAQSGETALERAAHILPELILLDVLMPGMDGFETCRRLKEHDATRDIPVIFMTALTETVEKVKGFGVGGIDFLTKPVQHAEVLARINAHLTIRKLQQQLQDRNARLQEKNAQLQAEISMRKQTEEALDASKQEQNHLRKEVVTLRSTIRDRYKFGDIVGKSHLMQAVYEQIVSAAASDSNAVISGESGTGKELVACTIHQLSERKDQAFVPVNCSAVPESLFEREFFGHRKGAFTGATMDKTGYFDRAHKGTLFLDEVAELNTTMQAKLLRVLQDGKYTPLGDTHHRTADVRIIAATNKDLKKLLQQGLVREDFFYRIRVIVIDLPPLRERSEDIPLLIEYFLGHFGKGTERSIMPGHLVQAFCTYTWPGNVRELQNEIQRYLAKQRLEFVQEELWEQNGKLVDLQGLSFREAVEAFEKRLIASALAQHNGHQGKAANMLDIPPKTLYNKIKKYKLKNDKDFG